MPRFPMPSDGREKHRKFAERDAREAEGWARYWNGLTDAERAVLTAEDPSNDETWPQPYAWVLQGGPRPPQPIEDRELAPPRRRRVPIVVETKAEQRRRPSNQPEGRRARHLARLVKEGKFASLSEADANTPRRGAS